jgi:hypothetical protein
LLPDEAPSALLAPHLIEVAGFFFLAESRMAMTPNNPAHAVVKGFSVKPFAFR